MLKKLKLSLFALVTVGGIGLSAAPVLVHAAPVDEIRQSVKDVGGGSAPTLQARFKDITNIILFIMGAVAVIMIIIGGFRYVTAGGDSGSVTAAKNTILYAVIGLIVALLAYAIVNFVVDSFSK